MKHFDSKIQKIRYETLKKIAECVLDGKSEKYFDELENNISDDCISSCCIYRERAIMHERIKSAQGKCENIINIIKPACEECSAGGIIVTDACTNCLSHKCAAVCDSHAILFSPEGKAVINRKKCIECGKCIEACRFGALISLKRPCEKSCRFKAISIDDNKNAFINSEKCTLCGLCTDNCPNGAVAETSFISDAAEILRKSDSNRKYKVYAVAEPSYASISYLKSAGFENAVSSAINAERYAILQAGELVDKGFVISRFCPAFINYLRYQFPSMTENISAVPSPIELTAQDIKLNDKNAKIILIASCAARKKEFENSSLIDCTITFDEADALIDSVNSIKKEVITEENLPEEALKYYISGNISRLLEKIINENGMSSFRYRSRVCSGMDECRTELLKSSKKVTVNTFIDASICPGGCGYHLTD